MNANSMNPEESGQAAEPGQPAESSQAAGTGSPEEPAQPQSGHTGGTAPDYAVPAPPQNFFNWIRSQGISRGRERWIGGVAGGIANRVGIDPLIVRGIFIILTLFAGIGILLYGVAWALLPEPDGRIHAQEAGAGRWSAGMTGALITTIIGLPSLGRGFWGWGLNGLPGILWTLFWVGGIIYLVYFLVQRNRARNGRQPMGTHYYAAAPGSPVGTEAQAPPGYPAGPYSAGPFPPAGASNRPERKRRQGPGAAIVAVSAGAALLAGATIKLLDAGNVIHLGDAANAVVWATGAAVLGLGILVAGFRGRTSGLLGFLAVATLVIGGIFTIAPNADHFRLQNAQWNPVSVDDARKGLDITGANGTVDLTKLNLSAPLSSDVVVPMDVTASNIKLLVPVTVPVEVQADMTFANLKQGGSAVAQSNGGTLDSFNMDKPGAKLVVKLNGTFSNVTVQEGN
jgi:phage shock protein PspC (stress-responsive transcriptional regulator)